MRKQFEDALAEKRRKEKEGPITSKRCDRCETQRECAEQFLSNIRGALQRAEKPLEPMDYIASIHYTPCFKKVIETDIERYGEGDLTLFEDIRRLSEL